MDDQIRTELEAAAFRGLVAHLKKRSDVQNIDLMNLAGFCRNCLSKWYRAAGEGRGIDITYDEAREIIYGMSYEEWKKNYQVPSTEEQQKTFKETKSLHADISGHNP
tara:strand:+ start:678 stop:998 length:321 start_codon:yes stop_codon:yes gene_type:complete